MLAREGHLGILQNIQHGGEGMLRAVATLRSIFLTVMVNLTTVARARKPTIIYGFKRGKVPAKLRPNILPKPQVPGGILKLHKVKRWRSFWAVWKFFTLLVIIIFIMWYFDVLEGSCMNEMYKLMACWKSNGFIDTHCQEEINLFLDCASNQVFLMTVLVLKMTTCFASLSN